MSAILTLLHALNPPPLTTPITVATVPPPVAAALDEGPSLLGTALRAFFPFLGYLFLAPVLWLFFRNTWRELDVAAHEHQKKTLASGKYDYRPIVLFVITAI